ncbi:hypothetical protein HB13667_28640 [Pseudomonas putida]|uniref:Uncharacterized protein n=1 Tax=Pseudomonas putida TaxID=303 RepID=A0A0P7CQJ2_PSEPU|nr:hypothetical protein [Pseudomonas putida]KPM58087.1 hypothetical protein HB13667_28640 [Pseudomonas putida]
MSKPSTEVAVSATTQPGLSEISELFAALKKVSKVSFDALLQVQQLVSGDGVSLHKDIVHFGLVAAPGTGHVALELRVREQFRERASALIATYL